MSACGGDILNLFLIISNSLFVFRLPGWLAAVCCNPYSLYVWAILIHSLDQIQSDRVSIYSSSIVAAYQLGNQGTVPIM